MNYRHAFHAGNAADVLKHVVLLALIESMQAKDAPFCYLDTHAGRGAYALDGAEAGRTGEHRDGVGRLLFPLADAPATPLPALIRRWLDLIVALPENRDGVVRYPGSPLLAALALRAQDGAQLCELQPEECAALRELFRHDPRVHVHQRDGYEALKALLPPKEKRGVVLIDPPYEAQEGEYRTLEASLRAALARWPAGVIAAWYPIKLRSQVQPFLRTAPKFGARRVLRAEMLLAPDDSPLRLNGSGMVIFNAPWQLDETLREPLAALAQRLAWDQPARWTLDWLLRDG